MFYAQFVLSKKGPLAKIWLAAHWEKKLSKQQIFETNVEKAVDEIMKPKVKMALRTTGHLLLGIVRIYSRKAKYLLADCNEAFLKIKMAFRPGQVDLPEDSHEAHANAITLPEVFTDFDTALPDFSDLDNQQNMSFNQSRIDEITLKEDLPSRNAFHSDFGGLDDFGESAMGGGGGMDEMPHTPYANASIERGRAGSIAPHTPMGGRMSDTPMRHNELATPIPSDLGDEDDGFGGEFDQRLFVDADDMFNDDALREVENMDLDGSRPVTSLAPGADEPMSMKIPEDSSFALHPLDAALMPGAAGRGKRKRRLIIDEVKNISGDEMKAQMNDYTDTLVEWELAPPNRRLMQLKHCTVERMFTQPSADGQLTAPALVQLYTSQAVYKLLQPKQVDPAAAKKEVLDDLAMLPADQLADWHEQQYSRPSTAQLTAIREEDMPMEDMGAPGEHDQLALDLYHDTPHSPDALSPRDRKAKQRGSKIDKNATAVEETFDDDNTADAGDVEDKRWTKRTQHILQMIKTKLQNADEDEIAFTEISKGATRKSAAQKFYTLLVLKKWQAIDVEQNRDEEFAEIIVKAGVHIDQTQTAAAH